MGSRKANGVRPGDRFVKVGKYETEWVVKEIVEFPNLPPHIHIAEAGTTRRALTFSLSALLDRSLFTPLRAAVVEEG